MNLLDLARAALAEQASLPVTPSQAAELRELVALIFADANDTDRAEVLRVAFADSEVALTSFRLLAADAMERKCHGTRFGGT